MNAFVGPLAGWLSTVQQDLAGLSLGVERGINLGQYLSPVSVLGPGWVAAVESAGVAAAVVAVVAVGRAGFRLYLWLKEAVMWW